MFRTEINIIYFCELIKIISFKYYKNYCYLLKKRFKLNNCWKMVMPKFVRILNKGLIAGAIVSTLGFFIKSIPCRIITKDSSSLGICQLPSIFKDLSASLPNYYFGISNNPLTGLILQFLLIFFIVTIFFLFFRKNATKILDLTNKE